MTDPAIEAAQKIWECHEPPYWSSALVAAAREALKPIRQKHYPVAYINRQRCCVKCYDDKGKPHLWPCPPALDAYTTEELER